MEDAMDAITYTEMHVGDPCWIFIKAGLLKGVWEGKVTSFSPNGGLYEVRACFTGNGIKEHDDDRLRKYFGKEPCCTFDVYPFTKDYGLLLSSYDLILGRVTQLENIVYAQPANADNKGTHVIGRQNFI